MIDSTNYDERYVGNHPLPELLECENGRKVESSVDWETIRRSEVLNLFESQVYGIAPSNQVTLNHEVVFTDTNALNGLAIRQEIHIYSSENKTGTRIDLQLYTPKNTTIPVPTFLGCNFNGNHAVDPNPEIPINHRWMRTALDEKNVVNHSATEFSRGSESSRWPLELIISNGFGAATFYYGDVEPDHAQCFCVIRRNVTRCNRINVYTFASPLVGQCFRYTCNTMLTCRICRYVDSALK